MCGGGGGGGGGDQGYNNNIIIIMYLMYDKYKIFQLYYYSFAGFEISCTVDTYRTYTVRCEGRFGVINIVACVYDSGILQEKC